MEKSKSKMQRSGVKSLKFKSQKLKVKAEEPASEGGRSKSPVDRGLCREEAQNLAYEAVDLIRREQIFGVGDECETELFRK